MKHPINFDDNSFWIKNFNINHLDSIICGDLLSKLLIPRRTSEGEGYPPRGCHRRQTESEVDAKK